MITEEHQKEGLSRAYIQAIAAGAMVNVSIGNHSHDYGIDGAFHAVSVVRGKRVNTGVSLEFQLKSTCCLRDEEKNFKYALDAQTHRCLADRALRPHTTQVILAVLALPKSREKWLELSTENLILRNCCYWVAPIWDITDNVSSVTIDIPKEQALTPESLQTLMRKISRGESLYNDCFKIYSSV